MHDRIVEVIERLTAVNRMQRDADVEGRLVVLRNLAFEGLDKTAG